ncbi:hypothetical protein PAXRUDRAFT_508485 [Paxillus rubicundulus Ve08.2h10]|uniref:Uncharacterized protein n=1 Tax=Paxillus rubicundulus Ve08.2h10 TaxID=930991 RepID=A0A0D0DCK7_9AGAM|nr:hypothetical protein PAXRUDRAFT_508485 [Paxillus rubicundulus Ve08.2h10]
MKDVARQNMFKLTDIEPSCKGITRNDRLPSIVGLRTDRQRLYSHSSGTLHANLHRGFRLAVRWKFRSSGHIDGQYISEHPPCSSNERTGARETNWQAVIFWFLEHEPVNLLLTRVQALNEMMPAGRVKKVFIMSRRLMGSQRPSLNRKRRYVIIATALAAVTARGPSCWRHVQGTRTLDQKNPKLHLRLRLSSKFRPSNFRASSGQVTVREDEGRLRRFPNTEVNQGDVQKVQRTSRIGWTFSNQPTEQSGRRIGWLRSAIAALPRMIRHPWRRVRILLTGPWNH